MDLFGAPFGGSAGSALFVGAGSQTGIGGSGGTIAWPAGTQVGDMALLRCAAYSEYGPPASWSGSTEVTETWTGDVWGNTGRLQWKVLSAGDLASPPAWTGYGIGILVYRGPTSVAFKGVVNYASAPTLGSASLAAFSSDSNSLGAVSFLNSDTGVGVLVGGVQRLTFTETYTRMIASDILAYDGSGPLVWTGVQNSPQRHASVYELT